MQDYPQCIVCTDIYGTKENHPRIPKILKCGHTICKECLLTIVKETHHKYFLCPECKEKIKKEKSIDDHITNREVIKIIKTNFTDIHNSKEEGKPIEYKIISLGNPHVGKSSLFDRLSQDKFSYSKLPTLGCFYYTSYYIKYHNKKYKLYCFDTAGQEKYRSIATSFIRKADGVLFLYDITDKSSFESLDYWYNTYKEIHENVVGLIIGNKCDLESQRAVDKEEAKNFATSRGLKFLEASALLDKMVKKSFAILLEEIIKSKGLENDSDSNVSPSKTFTSIRSLSMRYSRMGPKKKKCC